MQPMTDAVSKTGEAVLSNAIQIIDRAFGPSYAIKNPTLTKEIARILFDELCFLRSQAALRTQPSVRL